jgi:methionine aminopeptidase
LFAIAKLNTRFTIIYILSCAPSPIASHGIPDVRPLIAGDIVSIDISCFVDGVHGDCCGTFIVEPSGAGSSASGNAASGSGGGGGGGGSVTTVPRETRQLVEFARAVTAEAVALCAPGVPLQHIGAFIQVRYL